LAEIIVLTRRHFRNQPGGKLIAGTAAEDLTGVKAQDSSKKTIMNIHYILKQRKTNGY